MINHFFSEGSVLLGAGGWKERVKCGGGGAGAVEVQEAGRPEVDLGIDQVQHCRKLKSLASSMAPEFLTGSEIEFHSVNTGITTVASRKSAFWCF